MEEIKRRLRAAALVVQKESILLVEFEDETGVHYNLPGGGVEPLETLADAARREALEEASAEVEVGTVAFVYEYEPVRSAFRFGKVHTVSIIFDCQLKEGSVPQLSDRPDPNQTGVKWIPLSVLHTVQLYPDMTAEILTYVRARDGGAQGNNYLEDRFLQRSK